MERKYLRKDEEEEELWEDRDGYTVQCPKTLQSSVSKEVKERSPLYEPKMRRGRQILATVDGTGFIWDLLR
jgi:hypothetical protein